MRGWLPIRPLVGNHILSSLIDDNKTIGGLEIAIRFCKADDYVRVLDAAQQIGWQRSKTSSVVSKEFVSGRNLAPRSVEPLSTVTSSSSSVSASKPLSTTAESTKSDSRAVKCLVEIERAVHLASVYETASNRHVAPNAFVRFKASGGDRNESLGGETKVSWRQVSPNWNYQLLVAIATEFFVDENKYFVIQVFHRNDEERDTSKADKLLGNVCIDLQPLICGLTHISGWYNIQVT